MPVEGTTFKLFYSPEAALKIDASGFVGGKAIDLTYNPGGLSADVLARFPYLEGYAAFTINKDNLAIVPDILKSQVGIAAIGEDGEALDGTGLQISGVLDDLYTYDGAPGRHLRWRCANASGMGTDGTLYTHRNSPKTYSLPQLATCAILKFYLDLPYRDMEEWLLASDQVCAVLELTSVPDHCTLARVLQIE